MPLDLPDDAATGHGLSTRGGTAAPVLLHSVNWHVYATPTIDDPGSGRPVAEFRLSDGRTTRLVEDAEGRLHPPFDVDEAYANYLREAWSVGGSTRRLSTRQLALFYRVKRFIPRGAQLRARRVLIRWQGQPAFPRWPVDDSVARLAELYGALLLSRYGLDELGFRWFWPTPYRAALILTHDVEGEDGIRLAVELADLEESLGFRSAFNFGAWYEADPGVLRELRSRGFEIGMHGIVHDRSLFSSRAEFERQLPLLSELAEHLGAVGLRSPATHRVFDWLGELPIEYDGTIPHSDPYEPQPGGCCSLWPFFVGDVVELPYTLPQDHTLLTLLGHRTPDLWISAANEIEQRFGLIHCVSHPDPGYLGDPPKRVIYGEFLQAMSERHGVWHALPREVASWWRRRSTGADGAVGRVRLAVGDGAALIEPPATATRP
jgi:hypothetical protein